MRLKNSMLGINGKDISVNGDCTYVQQLYNHKRGPHALSRGYVISLVPISVLLVSGPDLLRPESNIRATGTVLFLTRTTSQGKRSLSMSSGLQYLSQTCVF
jgi:hypothetical protein